MGVYIKDMEMPKNCGECQFCHTENFTTYCCPTGREGIFYDAIPDWCPLAEVPTPHGDLIDRGELELDTEWDERDDWYTAYSQAQISDAPVIIEAEGVPRKWWEPKCEVTNG